MKILQNQILGPKLVFPPILVKLSIYKKLSVNLIIDIYWVTTIDHAKGCVIK